MTQEQGQRKPDIKPTKVVAAALAAVTSAFVGSRLGMAGTVLGAGFASVVTTVGGALYQQSLDKTSRSLRSKVGAADDAPSPGREAATVRLSQPTVRLSRRYPARSGSPAPDPPTRRLDSEAATRVIAPGAPAPVRRRMRWVRAVVVAVGVFAVGMVVVTGVELLHGGPISGGAGGTTMGGLFRPPPPSTARRPDGRPSSVSTGDRAPTSTSTPLPRLPGSVPLPVPTHLVPLPGPTATEPTTPPPDDGGMPVAPGLTPRAGRPTG